MGHAKDILLVIGIGNEYRSDDAVGLVAARRIRNLGLDNVEVSESDGDGAALIEQWTEKNNVLLIDAVQSGSAPGTLHIMEAGRDGIIPENLSFSTHSFGIYYALRLAASLKMLPENIKIVGIEGYNFTSGINLCPHVVNKLPEIETLVTNEALKIRNKY